MFSPSSSRSVATIPVPPAHGVNVWCLAAARRCALAGYSQAEAFGAIVDAAAGRLRAGRELSRQEVERAIVTAFETSHQPGASAPKIVPLSDAEIAVRVGPPVTEEAARAFVATSPLSVYLPSAEILATLFHPDDSIGLKPVNNCRAVRCRVKDLPALFAGTDQPIQFVGSSPISGRLEKTQRGRFSYVAKSAFPSQKFIVVEFDGVALGDQFARMLYLKRIAEEHAPLVMVMHSGGKSLHSWFQPLSADAADALRIAAVKLGADPSSLRVNQLVRCPNQPRDNGRMQSCLWLSGARI